MDRTNHLPVATRRMTTRTIAALCGIAAIAAATWLAWTSPGGMRVSLLTVEAAELGQGRRLFDHETPGWRAFDIGVSSRNLMNNPVRTFAVTDPCNNTIVVESPDPGILMTDVYDIPMLAQFLPPKESCILHPGFFANMFKTPQLRGVRFTAPYFHDNSAKDLEAVLEQYVFMFTSNTGFLSPIRIFS